MIGEDIAALRKQLNMTQEKFATTFDVHVQQVRRWEQNSKTVLRKSSENKIMVAKTSTDEKMVKNEFFNKMTSSFSRLQDSFMIDVVSLFYLFSAGKVPVKSSLLIVGALVYFISPIDMIPDFLIPLGFTDDIAVVAGVITKLGSDIKPKYKQQAKEWLDSQSQK